jgi:hypothetical protein
VFLPIIFWKRVVAYYLNRWMLANSASFVKKATLSFERKFSPETGVGIL